MFRIRAIGYKQNKARVLLEFGEDEFKAIVSVISQLADSAQFLHYKVCQKKRINLYRAGGSLRQEAVKKYRSELLARYEEMTGRPAEKVRVLAKEERKTLDRMNVILQLAREDRKHDSGESRKNSHTGG